VEDETRMVERGADVAITVSICGGFSG